MARIAVLLSVLVAPVLVPDVASAAERFPEPGVVPSFGIFQGHVFSDDFNDIGYTGAIPVFVGATFHPMPSRVSPISNIGVEADFYPREGHVDFLVLGRFGISILSGENHREMVTQMFPAFSVYALAGYRFEREPRPRAARVGLGISSPRLMLFSMTESCFPAPTTLEATVDLVDTKGTDPTYQIRLGWYF